MLIALGAAPVCGAASASVSGLVRDSVGVPQIGAEVQLLRPDLTVVASTYTNSEGRFKIAAVLPGRYALKAMAMSYLPSLRENVRVRTGTVVNLTLNTLYEVMQWLPAEPRARNTQDDDWAWTLRSAANRPLLRWLEDGPLVVVSDGTGAVPRLKARLMATGQAGTFGESGERFSATVEDTPSDSRELLARVDFAPGTNAGMESMLGFRQDLGFAGSVQSVAAVAIHPEISGPEGEAGLDEAAIRTWETLHLGDEFAAEVGSTAVVARFADQSSDTAFAVLPDASVDWRDGNSSIGYRVATMLPRRAQSDESQPAAWLPEFSAREGGLVVERGLHQEIRWQRNTDKSGLTVLVFADKLRNPVIEAMSHFGDSDSGVAAVALLDSASGLLRAAGPDFSSQGIVATVERRLSGGNQVRLSYANGNALVMPALPRPTEIAQALGAAHPRRTQTYTISLSGTLDGTETHWQASYRWQPEDTVTGVAPYAVNAAEPYLNLHMRQPIHLGRDGSTGIEALLDVRNMLAQGYRPFLLTDGSMLIFAQQQRGIRGGLAFTF
ncbi:MAG: carboxypeptidase-like regulatory domain-containing protein [Terracidiphilus sp.]|nr:carboxypeptidase-like regulatory domain-containing protein [Terracidiphilus sp.]